MNIICINFVGIERDRQTLQGVYMYNYVCILYSTEPKGVYMYTYNLICILYYTMPLYFNIWIEIFSNLDFQDFFS